MRVSEERPAVLRLVFKRKKEGVPAGFRSDALGSRAVSSFLSFSLLGKLSLQTSAGLASSPLCSDDRQGGILSASGNACGTRVFRTAVATGVCTPAGARV